jgi:hypothetical protein
MADRRRDDRSEQPTWESSRRELLELTLAATPEQRLAWLEEVLEIAHQVGALRPRTDEWGCPLDS